MHGPYKRKKILPGAYLPAAVVILPVVLSIVLGTLPCSGYYYEVPQNGRPRSAFSTCCCKKVTENSRQKLYNCRYIEIDNKTCPEDFKQYDAPVFGCPSELIFTRPSGG